LNRVLVVRADNLGDVIMCGPALRALRRAAPRARLELLASPAGAAAVPLLPDLDDVLVASASWQQLDPSAVAVRDDLDLVGRIRGRRYDAAVIMTSFSQSPWPVAYLCRLAEVPVRVGMSKEFGGAGLTHWVPPPPDEVHQADRSLYLLERVGVPPVEARLNVVVPDDARNSAGSILERHGVGPHLPYAVVLPGASCSSRRYAAERFATVVALLAEAGLRVVVAGKATESDLVHQVAAGAPGAVALAGALDVPALAAAVAGARVVVCNNSGGAHVASATRTPAVVLFSGTELEQQYSPRFTPAVVLRVPTPCSPCHQLRCPYSLDCLDVPPHQVAAHAVRLAARSGSGPL
jgi:ADP-heptose:LPS heptosyltransferase